ncbi:Long-chain-fatty-acid--CoA ligase [Oleidesulfovibrio alaskensis G20]|jgi:long-chain acyl-CoA synthetase|uniref:Long-chain-fatty-acid--CoA ligase n=1 Tax=Oleidesulfovibrio alaskensis (strain ATCC BAA-1058 / DSM 17464 / G20) TaxID=207559 RepID=Q317A2_OLEA2|nr:AMP-binding protein [Oleidesulfovibrio alaskensis]ABB36994.1 Long-chain-fatty-acid--CoA ligase [Oleidesulfovibrio alaskensis G20]MBG0774512.1 AMP-binding protein [Oleidesulfovibrio alaskensis]
MQSLEIFTLRHVLDRSAELFADQPALSAVGGTPVTYSEFKEQVETLSGLLIEQGIAPGDRVALLAENSPNWGIAFFAITTMGAVAVPILPEFHPDAVHHIIRHSESKAVFVSEKLFSKVEDGHYDETPVFLLMETFRPVELGTSRDLVREFKAAGLREFRRLKEKAMRLAQMEPAEVKEDDVASLIYTSGTTGHSKGVVLLHRNIVFDADAVKSIVQVGPGDRLLSILPLSHTYECTLGLVLPVLNGAHIHYMDKPPTARALIPAMGKVRPTCMLSVPLVIEKIYKSAILPKLTGSFFKRLLYGIAPVRKKLNAVAGKKLLETFGGKLRIFCIGGASLAPDVEQFLREAAFPYAIGYGLTETSPLVAGSGPAHTRFTSTGWPLIGVEVRIDAPDPATGEGEILVKGPNVMREYYKAPEITKNTFTEDGWFRTGDLGKFDADGYLYIKGRLKNVIVGPSGENIYPEEIEAVIQQSPYVLETLVYRHEGKLAARIHLDYARLDEEYGSLPAAKMAKKTDDLLEEIRTAANQQVASFARLHKVFEQTEPFEKTPTHKIKRYLYVEQQ